MSDSQPLDEMRPYSDADMVGPQDRPKGEWEITMYDWQVFTRTVVKEWLDEMAGTSIRAIQCFSKPKEGVIYVEACDPAAPKAHNVTLSSNHRTASFSLYTPLLPFDFKRISDKYKAVFKCWPKTYGEQKVLVIQVKDYRVLKVDKATKQAAEDAQAKPETAEKQEKATPDAPESAPKGA